MPFTTVYTSRRALWPQERLFFELYAYALRGRPGTEGFLDGIVESWVTLIAAALVQAGADERTARADARLSVAVVRGLLLDLVATGDRAGVTEAHERFLQHVSVPATPPSSGVQLSADLLNIRCRPHVIGDLADTGPKPTHALTSAVPRPPECRDRCSGRGLAGGCEPARCRL